MLFVRGVSVLILLSGAVGSAFGGKTDTECLVAYVAVSEESCVAVIDVTGSRLSARVPVGKTPWGIAVTPDGRSVYVTDLRADSVWVINSATHGIEAVLSVGEWPTDVVITPDGRFAYVSNGDSDDVSVIDAQSNTVVKTIKVGQSPDGLAVDPAGRFVYVANGESDSVSIIDVDAQEVVKTIVVAHIPRNLAVDPRGHLIYVANMFSASVSVIAVPTGTVIAEWQNITARRFPDSTANGITVSPDGRIVYVADSNAHRLSVIDAAAGTVFSMIGLRLGPTYVTLTPDGRLALATSWGATPIHGPPLDSIPGLVSVIETATRTVLKEIEVGLGCADIAIAPSVPAEITGVEEVVIANPAGYCFSQNIPNPFNRETQIRYEIPTAGHVTLMISNLMGQVIRALVDDRQDVGRHTVTWDGRDSQGRAVPSGVYVHRLTAGGDSIVRKMVLTR